MSERWPSLVRSGWEATRDHLHLWTQMMGKVVLAYAPPVNHWWHVTLRVSPRGLATPTVVTPEGLAFSLELDLLTHRLVARASDGRSEDLPLRPGTIAAFFVDYQALLGSIGLHPRLLARPVEMVVATPFEQDHVERPYDREWAEAFFGALRQSDRLLKIFRGAFIGKASPVHFFWGGFDLAVTRFSGRRAPLHPGGVPNCPDFVAREAYSHECSSAGFWPGGGGYAGPAFYSYIYPEPPQFAGAHVEPGEAFYDRQLREFILPYEAVRAADAPDRAVLMFLQSTYAAAADTGNWNRAALERAFEQTNRVGDESWATSASTSRRSSELPLT